MGEKKTRTCFQVSAREYATLIREAERDLNRAKSMVAAFGEDCTLKHYRYTVEFALRDLRMKADMARSAREFVYGKRHRVKKPRTPARKRRGKG